MKKLIAIVLLLSWKFCIAQEAAISTTLIEDRTRTLADASVQIVGADNPSAVPLHLTMYWFLGTYQKYMNELSQVLTPSELLIIERAARAEDSARDADVLAYAGNLLVECARLEERDPISLATFIDDVTASLNSHQESRYEQILSSISNSAQDAVKELLVTEIAPHVSFATTDNSIIARRDPEFFQQLVRSECDFYLGRSPVNSGLEGASGPIELRPTTESLSGEEIHLEQIND